jgi:glycosyltransferase involved in cell wall biosynthesis
VAMFRLRKNQRELVATVAGLSRGLDWQLWFAGDGETRSECERLARSSRLGARIKFLGWQRDPSPFYLAADVAVHASWSESLSNFVIEAQAHGLPAVVYEAQGIGECFLPGDTGFVVARGDRAAFRLHLERLARAAPAERATRAERARAYAAATFDPQQHVAAHLELFARLLSGKP